jgi:hypothetical protein
MEGEGIKYNHIPSLTPTCVHDYLRAVGKKWIGGVAMELGCWLGASAVPLLEGLVQAGYNEPFYAFDRWTANGEQVEVAKKQNYKLKDGQDTLPVFLENTMPVYSFIVPYKGEIMSTLTKFKDRKISICIFDAPKIEPTFSFAAEYLIKYFIPGVTVWGLLDYNFYLKKEGEMREKFKAPVNWMENHKNHFMKLIEWPGQCSCAFFKYIKKI